MVAQSRTLKLSILADVDQLKKSLNSANADVENSSSKLGDFSKKAGVAFAAAAAAAGAYAVKLAVDGVKAAIEDEAAQIRLATALKNATGATDQMIASVEKQILKTSLATGVADDKLRPALQRLSLSTNDVTKAQDLLNLALDISQATGKGLDSVANALGKAYDGNTAALGKLGVGLSAAELKAMSFTDVQTKLSDLFGGAAAANSETFAGRLEILKVTFDEAKESIGARLLPIIQSLVEFVVNKVVPALGKFADFFKPITKAIDDNKESFILFIEFIQTYVVPVLVTVLGGALQTVGKIAGAVVGVIGSVIKVINTLIQGTIDGINFLIRAYNAVNLGLPDLKPVSAGGAQSGGSFSSISGVLGSSAPSSSVTMNTPPPIKIPDISSAAVASAAAGASKAAVSSKAASVITGHRTDPGSILNLTVNGAIDSEGTARTIVNTLNDSYFRGTGGSNQLVLTQ
jgi:phage-related protein